MKKLEENERQLIKNMIADKLGFDTEEVTDNSEIRNDLAADSLDEVELVMELEKIFNISIPDWKYEEIDTVKVSDLYGLVENEL